MKTGIGGKIVNSKEVIILIGVPGSGKTTYLKNVLLPKKIDYVVCSTDDLIEEKAAAVGLEYEAGYRQFSMKETEREFKEKIWAAIEDGKNVILDRTNLMLKGRNKMLSYFDMKRPREYKKTAILFDFTDVNKIRVRLQQRFEETGKYISENTLQQMLRQYQEPTTTEFHEIIKL